MALTKLLRLKAVISQPKHIKIFLENAKIGASNRRLFSSSLKETKTTSEVPSYMTCSNNIQVGECQSLHKDMVVFENFLSETEEKIIFDEIEPYMSRLHYEYDHWDNAIHGFRETERLHWTQPSMLILDKVRQAAFPKGKPQLRHVHVLDLSADGYIKPHIDSIKFCGDTIAGLSLLSDSVMRLVHEKDKTKVVDVILKQRSLYIMRDSARYDYTHEILKQDDSKFKGVVVPKGRRISVICRSEVTKKQ